MFNSIYYQYWGKADKVSQSHLLVYHCLDVAAVGQVFLEQHESLRHLLAHRLGLDEETFVAWNTFFLALHDLGKFSESFQNLQPEIFQKLRQCESHQQYRQRHDSLGFFLWQKQIQSVLFEQNLFLVELPDNDYWQETFNIWAKVVTGHHGQPPKSLGTHAQVDDYFSDFDQQAAQQFIQDWAAVILNHKPPVLSVSAKETYHQIKRVSWWLAGIAVLSDWIGSGYFKYQSNVQPLEEYWPIALAQAKTAILTAGVLPTPSNRLISLPELVNDVNIKQLTPLQAKVSALPLTNTPQLFILEEVTGTGKTEAAMMLVHRLMAAGLAEGFYIALPTMATANAMYERMVAVYQRLFLPKDSEQRPSLVLAHGARDLSKTFRQSILSLPNGERLEADYAPDDDAATALCHAWFADNRNKSLLADAGVGTLDQALLAILKNKFQSLRLLGLARKVLIVDEVHAYDAYMNGLLIELLSFHASIGGSAILLSATLPLSLRQRLVTAYYSEGKIVSRKAQKKSAPSVTSMAYPLLTHLMLEAQAECREVLNEYSVNTGADVARLISVQLCYHQADVYQVILAARHQNQCVCWIRNTVADAIEAYFYCRDVVHIPATDLLLFHARFALGDRLDIEKQVLCSFGKQSRAVQRQRKVLIATQVVEQSLDLDFDVMVSDLAPIDLLIQRAGRLCRHSRDKLGNYRNGQSDQRGEPQFYVYTPKPVDAPAENWFSEVFPRAAFVYQNPAELWFTAQLLLKYGRFDMPENVRTLIEGVYGDEREPIPAALEKKELEAIGKNYSDKSAAKLNGLNLNQGYNDGSDWTSSAPTRLDDDSLTIRLARYSEGQLIPWYQGADSEKEAWRLSEVNVRGSLINKEPDYKQMGLQSVVDDYEKNVFDNGKWRILIIFHQQADGQWVGEGGVNYDAQFGLRVSRTD